MAENEKKAAEAFAHCASILSIDLLKNNFECFPGNAEPGGSLEISVNSHHDHFSEDNDHKYTVEFEIEIIGLNENGDEIFTLKSKFLLIYDLEQCASFWEEKEREFFKNRNAILHAWPYIREHVDRITGSSPIPRAILPLYPLGK